jgi:hypothetical protein
MIDRCWHCPASHSPSPHSGLLPANRKSLQKSYLLQENLQSTAFTQHDHNHYTAAHTAVLSTVSLGYARPFLLYLFLDYCYTFNLHALRKQQDASIHHSPVLPASQPPAACSHQLCTTQFSRQDLVPPASHKLDPHQ